MKYIISLSIVIVLLLSPFGSWGDIGEASAASLSYEGYPTFSIVSVNRDSSVTIKTYNLPPNHHFKVRMGKMGTRAINGIVVGSFNAGHGGTKVLTFRIPASLFGSYKIAIRFDSTTGSGYYAYNWFYNNTTGGNGGGNGNGGYHGFPTFSILSVVRDKSVTIKTNNLPPNDHFKALMNYMGTRGINGVNVGSFDTDPDGVMKLTFDIPAKYHGQYKIAIRIESTTGSGYYAYNWFYNNTTGGKGGAGSGYSGYPTFTIVGVKRNSSVTIKIKNLPPNDEFKTLMNYMGTRGVNGVNVGSFGTGEGGTKTLTFEIPSKFYGQRKIAIRIESKTGSGYYAYNWFYNNTTN